MVLQFALKSSLFWLRLVIYYLYCLLLSNSLLGLRNTCLVDANGLGDNCTYAGGGCSCFEGFWYFSLLFFNPYSLFWIGCSFLTFLAAFVFLLILAVFWLVIFLFALTLNTIKLLHTVTALLLRGDSILSQRFCW